MHLHTTRDPPVDKVEQALRTVASNRQYWDERLTCALHAGAFHAVNMGDENKRALEAYHEPLAFAADGKSAQTAPELRLTATISPQRVEDSDRATCDHRLAPTCKQTSVSALCPVPALTSCDR